MKRRRPLRRMSPKVRALIQDRQIIRGQVFARDNYQCRLAVVPGAHCGGHLTPHHVRKASQGGGYTIENLVTCCLHCNDRLEWDPLFAADARTLGLVARRGDPRYDELGAA